MTTSKFKHFFSPGSGDETFLIAWLITLVMIVTGVLMGMGKLTGQSGSTIIVALITLVATYVRGKPTNGGGDAGEPEEPVIPVAPPDTDPT